MNDKYKSFYTRNCGMHIHISRKAFNDIQLYKFVLMLNEYKQFTHFISQRKSIGEYSQWSKFIGDFQNKCKSHSVAKIKRMKYDKTNGTIDKYKFQADVNAGHRYQVVNLQNRQTIEVRSFKGNLSEVGFRKNIEFLDCMYWFTKDNRIEDFTIDNFVKFVRSDAKTYKHLNKFFDINRKTLVHVLQNPTELF